MSGRVYKIVYDLAIDQFGFVTVTQAAVAGVERHALLMMERRGDLERVSRGVYRVVAVPMSALGGYMVASLWPHPVPGVLSHATVLELYELSDVNPTKIHLMVPMGFRTIRRVPGAYVLHHANLPPKDITVFEGIPTTTPARAIRDCAETGLGPALIRQAIEDGRRIGRLGRVEADHLVRDLRPFLRRRVHPRAAA